MAFPAVLALAGCVAPILEGGHITKDKAVLSSNLEAAESGDAEAQSKVGDAY